MDDASQKVTGSSVRSTENSCNSAWEWLADTPATEIVLSFPCALAPDGRWSGQVMFKY